MLPESKKLHRRRPWYRPHAAAVVVAIAMAGLLAAVNASSFRRMDGLVGLYQHGWPFAFFRRRDDHLMDFHGFGIPLNQPDEFSAGSLIGDIATASAIVAVGIVLAERRIRRKGRLAQFSLREMLALIAVVGVVAGHEMSFQRRQREAVGRLFQSRHNHFGVDEGLPHWLHDYLPGERLRPFDRVTSAKFGEARTAEGRLAPLANLDSLTTLFVSGNAIDDDVLVHLECLSGLTWLSASRCRVSDAGLANLAELEQLRFLDLNSTKVEGAGLRHLSKLRRLKSLDLNGTLTNDDGLSHLKEIRSLEDLHLCSTSVTDYGMVQLLSCDRLRTLELTGTRVSDKALTTLMALKTLKGLDVRDTQVSDTGLAAFRAALPDCRLNAGGQ